MSFVEQLGRQWEFLQRSCRDFDEGHSDEAVRIAVALRVLFHDTGKSRSLLTHLNIKNTATVLTTFEPGFSEDKKAGRVSIYIPMWVDQTGDRRPPLDSMGRHEFVSTMEWWEQVVMGSNQMPSRKAVVLSAANQDGGAHVDATPNEITQELRSGIGTFEIQKDGVTITKFDLVNHHFPLLRQFAYEVLNSPDIWKPLAAVRS